MEVEANLLVPKRQSRTALATAIRCGRVPRPSQLPGRREFSLREHDHLPTLSAGIPILLEVDPGLDMDDLQKTFGFEIVAEHEDGFVIVASQDIHLATLLQKINDFPGQVFRLCECSENPPSP